MKQYEGVKRVTAHGNHKLRAGSSYLKELIYGGVDGSTTTFAVVAGFSGAALSNETTTQLSFLVVLLFGLANLFADGISMGLGNFLAVRSEQSLYKSIRTEEKRESRHNAEEEMEETKHILLKKGFSYEDAVTLTQIYKGNDAYWVDFLMDNELRIVNPTSQNPFYTGLATFLAFIFFGLIPLIPFMVLRSFDPETVFLFSVAGTAISFILLGVFKWRIVGNISLLKSVGEILLIGGAAALIAFTVGSLFTL